MPPTLLGKELTPKEFISSFTNEGLPLYRYGPLNSELKAIENKPELLK